MVECDDRNQEKLMSSGRPNDAEIAARIPRQETRSGKSVAVYGSAI